MVQITYPAVLLILIVPYIVYYFWPMKEPTHKPIKLISIPLLKNTHPRISLILVVLSALSYIFLTFAIARPVYYPQPVQINKENYNIMFAVDLSLSMGLKDMKTKNNTYDSRLNVLKKEIKEFVKKRNNDNFGLIIFGEKAFVMVPLTSDLNLYKSFVDEMDTNLAGVLTSIGDAVILGSQTLANNNNNSENKILILLTDGRDTVGAVKTDDAITYALNKNVKIYTIGYGSENKDVNKELDKDTLKKIAEETGGVYFRATDHEALERIYENINATEQKKASVQYYQPKVELYYIPLLISLLLSFLVAYLVRRHYD